MLWDTRPPPVKTQGAPSQKTTPTSTPTLASLDLSWKPFYKVQEDSMVPIVSIWTLIRSLDLQIPLPRSELPKTFSATRVSLSEKQRERSNKANDIGGKSEGMATDEEDVPPIISMIGAGSGERIENASTSYFVGTEVSDDLRKKNCTDRESNPGLPRGRREFYH